MKNFWIQCIKKSNMQSEENKFTLQKKLLLNKKIGNRLPKKKESTTKIYPRKRKWLYKENFNEYWVIFSDFLLNLPLFLQDVDDDDLRVFSLRPSLVSPGPKGGGFSLLPLLFLCLLLSFCESFFSIF